MRCPDCNKMVPYGEPTTEINNEEISSQKKGDLTFSGEVSFDVRLVLPCENCGTELKETTFEFTLPFEHICKEGTKIEKDDEEEDNFELSVEAEPTERFQSKDPKTGKLIPSRYQKRFFGVEVRGDITCTHCKTQFEVTENEECQTSSMDELV